MKVHQIQGSLQSAAFRAFRGRPFGMSNGKKVAVHSRYMSMLIPAPNGDQGEGLARRLTLQRATDARDRAVKQPRSAGE